MSGHPNAVHSRRHRSPVRVRRAAVRIACLGGLLLAAPLPAGAAELVIRVVGLRSAMGEVHFAIYDTPELFPTYEGRVARGHVPARAGGTVIRLPGVSTGRYAVAIFHDENGNGSFDQGFLGIPLEDYGFSNNARGFFAPPSFESAAFDIGEPSAEIEIDLRR